MKRIILVIPLVKYVYAPGMYIDYIGDVIADTINLHNRRWGA